MVALINTSIQKTYAGYNRLRGDSALVECKECTEGHNDGFRYFHPDMDEFRTPMEAEEYIVECLAETLQ